MRVELEKLMEKLGVGKVLSPYETCPWLHYDADKGITASAEVRMGPNNEDVEAEIQFLRDEDTNDKDNEKDNDDDSDTFAGIEIKPGGHTQIMYLRAAPVSGMWTTKILRVKGEDYDNKIYDWEGKGCDFFKACVQAMQMGELPDIEELITKELGDDSKAGGGKGKIGRKSPKIKPQQLLGMKKGV